METTQDDRTSPDRSLEDVLFGEESVMDGVVLDPIDAIAKLEETENELRVIKSQAEHSRALLNESEAANSRLTEQTRLLKEEIRRLERNEERKTHFENTEYLKNVIIKFITPERVSAEKTQLVPILNTMLRLSEEELSIVQRAATQQNPTTDAGASWGSYLRWGGLS